MLNMMIFDRVVKLLLSLEIKIVMIKTICNSKNCRENIRFRLFEFSSLLDVMMIQRILLIIFLKNQAHIIQT